MITALGRLTQEDQEFRSSLSNRMVDRVMLTYMTSAPREPRQEDQAFKATHQILSQSGLEIYTILPHKNRTKDIEAKCMVLAGRSPEGLRRGDFWSQGF